MVVGVGLGDYADFFAPSEKAGGKVGNFIYSCQLID